MAVNPRPFSRTPDGRHVQMLRRTLRLEHGGPAGELTPTQSRLIRAISIEELRVRANEAAERAAGGSVSAKVSVLHLGCRQHLRRLYGMLAEASPMPKARKPARSLAQHLAAAGPKASPPQ